MADAYYTDPNVIKYIAGKTKAEVASGVADLVSSKFPVSVADGGTGAVDNKNALSNLGFRYSNGLKVTVQPGDQNWAVNAFEGFRDIPLNKILHVVVGTNVASGDSGWRISWDTWEGRNRIDIYSPVYQDVWFNMLVIYEK